MDTNVDSQGVKKKLWFGSDFPYRFPRNFRFVPDDFVFGQPSFAKGGFSRIWGASSAPLRRNDFDDWPIDFETMAVYYKLINEFVPLRRSRFGNSCSEEFLNFEVGTSSPPQIEEFAETLQSSRTQLLEKGVRYSSSILAVKRNCISCGNCLFGCPFDLIYSSKDTIEDLAKRGKIRYFPGFFVQNLHRTSERTAIIAKNVLSGDSVCFDDAARVFVGAGPFESTRLLSEYSNLLDKEIALQDSQYFIFPILRFRGVANFRDNPMTLAQIYLQLNLADFGFRDSLLQVYSWNPILDTYFEKSFPNTPKQIKEIVLSRMLIGQGYLHSKDSHRILLKFQQSAGTTAMSARIDLNNRSFSAIRTLNRSKRLIQPRG